ncbi:MAG: hypothetical protein MK078_11480 [Crocinitomicaceae bacterium]|nr:hypothetical protein [Crocinitomicaceae bacterium]
MKKAFLFLLIILGSFLTSNAQTENTLRLELPEILFTDIPSEIQVNSLSDIPDTLVINGVTTEINTLGNSGSFEMVVPSDCEISIQGYDVNYDKVGVVPLWTSILPPLIAILLALVFKEVIFSLVSGIFIGSAIIGFYAEGFVGIFTGFFKIIDTYIIQAMNDSGHLSVILFSIVIGGIVALISRNGGMKGIVNSIAKFANNVRNGQLATWGLGIAIFFDDYANTLVVGNTMRAVTDKLKISREKLAYIVDSTAAPVSSIAFVTTWIGAELVYITTGLDKINADGTQISEGVYSIFLNSLMYSFYPILTLFFIFYIVWRKKDYGPMYKAEARARQGGIINPEENSGDLTELEDLEPVKGIKYRAMNAVIPVAIIVFGTLIGLIYTGFESLAGTIADIDSNAKVNTWSNIWSNIGIMEGNPETFTRKLGTLIGAADSYIALLWSSLTALLAAVILTVSQRIMNLRDSVETVITGFKTMVPAILILILAWALASVTEEMHTADYITSLVGNIYPWLIPGITFVLAAFVAFSTGSSWSTMALVYPIILPAAWTICAQAGYDEVSSMGIFYNVVSAVLAGSVLGDHCSPISDTTILSSLASGCNHIDHVRTQIPYALTVGFVAVVLGTIPAALGLNPILCFIIGIGALIGIVEVLGKRIPEDNNG